MKKSKKFISLIVSLCVMISMLSASFFESSAYSIDDDLTFGVTLSGSLFYKNGKAFYKFNLASYTTLMINYEARIDGCWNGPEIEVIKQSDIHSYNIGKEVSKYYKIGCECNENYAWLDKEISLNKGSYYLIITAGTGPGGGYDDQDYDITVTPTVKALKNLKYSSSSGSVKLSWTGDNGAKGYQVQKYASNGYTLVKTTTAFSYTAKNLRAANIYKFRVRGYTNIGGKTYYGPWQKISTVTKPSKVTIKNPSTNSKHQITAKWKKTSSASGYQVQYSKNKSCSNVFLTKTISGSSKISYTAKKFKKNKRYYIRVRAYKTINGKKYYSEWSSKKSIKCK